MNRKAAYIGFLFLVAYASLALAGNPIITSKFTADPCALVHGNTVYLYTGHDEASTTDTDYRMDNWHVFSSQDMVNWKDHGQKLAVSNFSWANSHAFAGHTVHRNGKFYWYVPMIQKGGGYFSIGVAVADNPLGPFTDALGKALILDNMTPDLQFDIDPAVFIDDDGQAYIYWGNATANGPCKVAKLKSNMIELDGAITTVNIPNFTEAPYVHKKNGTYYLSYASGWPESIVYCTSTSPMGPWTYRGVINTTVTSATNHQSIIDFKGKSYFVYHNAFPNLGGGDYRRSVCVDLLTYTTNGTIQQVVRTTQGVAPAGFASEVTPWLAAETLTGTHDPSMIRDERGVYTMMSTNNLLEIRQSTNMINWTSRGRIFNAVPSWMTSIYSGIENIWAPHIYYRNGRYWVYYCGSTFGSNNSIIGVASSPTLDYQAANYAWTDHGEVLRTSSSNNYNAIDPELLVDKNGKVWMSFGSWWTGIKMVEIDPATGKRLASNSTVYSLASRGGSGIEGPSTIEHNGYYFLFTAWDKCCDGTNSTYRTMVGRSQSPTGTYVDKQNRSLMNNYSEEALKGYGRYYGPGGGSPFKDGRRDYFVHHYYNGNQSGAPTLQIREIVWDDGNWPVLTQPFLGRRLSYEAEHAILTNATIATNAAASNKEYVGYINFPDSKVLFYVNAFAAGEYTLRIRYASGNVNASHFLKVNNGTSTEVLYPKTAAFGQFPIGQAVYVKVTLKEGANTLEFTKGTDFAELDRIDLIRNTFEKIEGGASDDAVGITYVPSGNNASMSANSFLKFENLDFANGDVKNLTIALASSASSQFRISVDAQNGATNVTFTTSATNNVFVLPTSFQSITGIHDVFVTLISGACTLDYIQFDPKDPKVPVTCTATLSAGGATTFCAGGSVVLSASNGSAFQWKKDGTNISNAIAQTYTASSAGSYSVEVTCTSGAKSTPSAITVTVNAVPDMPAVTTPVTYWQNAVASPLSATGTDLKWYTASSAGSASTSPPTPATGNAGTTAYYVSQTANGCESARASIQVSVISTPSGFILQGESACTVDGILSENSNSGYTGGGYLNTNNATGSSAVWSVNSPGALVTDVMIRFANGGSTGRSMSVSVNDQVQTASLNFPSTGSFTSWNTVTIPVSLKDGINRIKFASLTADGGPNIDLLVFSNQQVTSANCNAVPTALGKPGATTLVSVYPNPSTEVFRITASEKIASYAVLNSEGIVVEERSNHHLASIDDMGRSLLPGVYHLMITYENAAVEHYKIVKIK